MDTEYYYTNPDGTITLKKRNMPSTLSKTEQLAREMYDDYCTAVGGKSFKGEDLPKSEVFFTDSNTTKQATAWIVAAETAINFITNRVVEIASEVVAKIVSDNLNQLNGK